LYTDNVFQTVDNEDKKAGALNQYLAETLPLLSLSDKVLVVDADTILSKTYIEKSLEYADDYYDGVGGVFDGKHGHGFVGWCQRNEFSRYKHDVKKLKGKAIVLTGTSAMFSVGALQRVADSRPYGNVYDTEALTEDAEISLRLKHLGHEIIAPVECATVTDIMPTWKKLYKQRLRWRRGFVENLKSFGITKHTWEYWCRQALAIVGIGVTALYLTSLVFVLLVVQSLVVQPIFLAMTGIFIIERIVTVRKRGFLTTVAASVMIIELVYEIFLQATYSIAYAKAFAGTTKGEW
jgi:cellulose synthase/poly-beta-1,6-N-acetylglucosamine synthase-like glycosyltransferase